MFSAASAASFVSLSVAGPLLVKELHTKKTTTFEGALGALALFCVILFFAQVLGESLFPAVHRQANFTPTPLWTAVLGLVFFSVPGAAWLFTERKNLGAHLVALPFSAAILCVLIGAVSLGTFVHQNLSVEECENLYGAHLAAWLSTMRLTAIFHAYWFVGLLALLCLSLTLTALKRFSNKWSDCGSFFAHGGIAVLFCGAALGAFGGQKGSVRLYVGEQTDLMHLTEKQRPTNHAQGLDFTIRLDQFEIENHPPQCRLLTYKNTGADWKRVRSKPLASFLDGQEHAVKQTDTRFKVKEFYPDFQMTRRMRPTDDPTAPTALEMEVFKGATRELFWLVAGKPHQELRWGQDLRFDLADARTAADLPAFFTSNPEKKMLLLTRSSGEIWSAEVEVGGEYDLPDRLGRVRVTNYYPDFTYDMNEKRAATRSQEPRNPALRLEAVGELAEGRKAPKWLYALHPSAHDAAEELPLRFQYVPEKKPAHALILADATTREFAIAQGDGANVKRLSFRLNEPLEISLAAATPPTSLTLKVLQLLPHAKEELVRGTRSETLRNPAALVELLHQQPQPSEEFLLIARHESLLPLTEDKRFALGLEISEPPKIYRSTVTFSQDNRALKTEIIEVNRPASFGDYYFYQTDWGRDEYGTYSTLSAVKDPGLWLTYLGVILSFVGLIFRFYVRPHLQPKTAARKTAAAGSGEERS
jgi:hypothetical protein